jgi:polyhydroxyalkanoate synthesis regulator phasin
MEAIMLKVFKEAYMASLGIINLTHEKALEISDELIKKGELSKDRRQKFTTDLLEEARQNTYRITKIINSRMKYIKQKDLNKSSGNGKVITRKKLKKEISQIIQKGIKMNEEKKNNLEERIIKTDEEKIREVFGILRIPTKGDLKEIEERLDILIKSSKEKGE